MNKMNIEKSLKRFLKKKVSFSVSLLVSFLITGGIAFGATEIEKEIKIDRIKLLEKIELEKDKISKKLSSNESLIKKYNEDLFNLVEEGNFYSKPVWNSNQVFFTYNHINSGKVKDNTKKEWADTIAAVKKNNEENGIIMSSAQMFGMLRSNYGIFSNTEVKRETLELGANINVVSPELKISAPKIQAIKVNTEEPTPITTKEINITDTPQQSDQNVNMPTVAINIPGAVAVPTEVGDISIDVPEFSAPTEIEDKETMSFNVVAPENYKDKVVKKPIIPVMERVISPKITIINLKGGTANPDADKPGFWNANQGIMSEVSLLSGTYDISSENNNYNIVVTGYNPIHYGTGTTLAPVFPSETNKTDIPLFKDGVKVTSEQLYFDTICNSPFVEFKKGVVINFNADNKILHEYEVEGEIRQNTNLDDLVKDLNLDVNLKNILRSYQEYTGIRGTIASSNPTINSDTTPNMVRDGKQEFLLLNSGDININGDDSQYFYTTLTHTGTAGGGAWKRTSYIVNNGNINVNGDESIVYTDTPDTISWGFFIAANTDGGKININGRKSLLTRWIGNHLHNSEFNYVNDSEININGSEAIALYMAPDTENSVLAKGNGMYIKKAINLLGDKSVGFVAKNKNITNPKNLVKFDIGTIEPKGLKSNQIDDIFTGRKNDSKLVEQSIGIYNDAPNTMSAAQIEIGKHAYGSFGIYSNSGKIDILKPLANSGVTESFVKTIDGENNIGIYANGGNIDYTGNVKIENGKGNKLIIAQDGNVIIKGELKATNTEDTISVYADGDGGKTPKITQSTGEFDINLKGNSTGIIAKSGGTVTIDKDNVTTKNIVIDNENGTGTKNTAIGILADTGGKVNFENGNVVVKNGASGLVSTGANSEVNLKGGVLDYLGNGYALYTADGGKIDLSNSTLKLRGKAVAYETGANIISAGTTIEMLSNDAIGIIAKLGNSNNMNISTLDNDISTIAGGAVFTPGKENGITYDKYKIAVVDGGNINIDRNIDKSGIVSSTDEDKKLGHIFYNNFQGQKMNLTVEDGVEVKALLDSEHANAYYDGNVIALEMSGSDTSTKRDETKIDIGSGARVLAGRTDSGAGAIGAFINYGELTNKGTIEVEKNSKNTGAVGIYGVNGSKIQNDETINVHGDKSIGIFAKAYREDNVKEFATDSGTTEIINKKNIALDGKGSIGIYGTNNNTSGTTVKIKNTGNIKVGASSTDGKNTAVGIYGEKATIDNSGNIEVSEKGIGIYGSKNSTINASGGIITLGNSGEGIVTDDTSTLNLVGKVTLVSKDNTSDAKGIVYNEKTASINQDIDGNNLKAGILVYGKNSKISTTTGKTLDVGENSIGIYAKGGNIENNSTLNLSENGKGTGLYGNGAAITNKGDINVNAQEETGIYAKGGSVVNSGNIKLNKDNTVAIALEGSATGNVDGTNITFGGASQKGIYANKSSVNLKDDISFASANEKGNIYVYGKDGSAVNVANGKKLTVDGTTTNTTSQNKTLGVYLENENSKNTFTGKLDVKGEAIGVYSKGENDVNLAETTVSGKSVAVYGEGNVNLSGNMNISEGIGVYGKQGKVNVSATDTYTLGTKDSTAFYLSDGSYLDGEININNTHTTLNERNIGVYYKGSEVENNAKINLAGTNSIALYVGNNAKVTNKKEIASTTNDNIGAFVKSEYISDGDIKLTGTNTVGLYIEGKATNNKNITAETGVYIKGASSFVNKGTITAKNGIYLDESDTENMEFGIININTDGVGVIANNSKVGKNIEIGGDGVLGVFGENNTVISGNINSTGKGSRGLYLKDDSVKVENITITTGVNDDTNPANVKSSVGVVLEGAGTNYNLKNVNIDAKNGVGIYMEDEGALGSGAKTLEYSGEITTTKGVGVYVNQGNTFNGKAGTINIKNGSTGIAVNGGTINLGDSTNKFIFNFTGDNNIGIYTENGVLNLNNIGTKGNGILVSSKNSGIVNVSDFEVSGKSYGLFGNYDNSLSQDALIKNTKEISALDGAIAIVALEGNPSPTKNVYIESDKLIVSGKNNSNSSIGIYTDIADVKSKFIEVKEEGLGINLVHKNKALSLDSNEIKMTGALGTGISVKGKINNFKSNKITGGEESNGIILENVSNIDTDLSIGTINLKDKSTGLFVKTSVFNKDVAGIIEVENESIGVRANGSTLTIKSDISTGNKGIGIYATDSSEITVTDITKVKTKEEGTYAYAKDSQLTYTGNLSVTNKQKGFVINNGKLTSTTPSTISVTNGGVGLYTTNEINDISNIKIDVTGAGNKKSIGIYYKDINRSVKDLPNVSLGGENAVGIILDNSKGKVLTDLSIGNGKDLIGVYAKNKSSVETLGVTLGNGDKNYGIYGDSSEIKTVGNISVGSSSDLKNSSIGVYLKGGSYEGTGNLTVEKSSIGLYGTEMTANLIQKGDMVVENGALGIYGTGSGTIEFDSTVANTKMEVQNNAIGIYALGMNTDIKGNMEIGSDTAVGIVSEGNGNINFVGDVDIANRNDTGSIGVYKKDSGTSNITIGAGTWNVGNNGFGIFLENSNDTTINNSSDINLKTSAVGIYSDGNNKINNSGTITVGDTFIRDLEYDALGNPVHSDITKHENSVGIYLTNGSVADNTGKIIVDKEHSVGVFAMGTNSKFINNGIMNVDNGGVGILVADGAIGINNKNITLGSGTSVCGADSIGMVAQGENSKIINKGTITVGKGIGMFIGAGSSFENSGNIIITNGGTGIKGIGKLVNTGNITVNGTGSPIEEGSISGNMDVGAVVIDSDGTIEVNGNYITTIGATLKTVSGKINVDGAYVDVANSNISVDNSTPVFKADAVTGNVNILPNFATTGNGITYEIENFVNAASSAGGTSITPIVSPMYVAKITTAGNLLIVKRPYSDISIGGQKEFTVALDNIIESTQSKDKEILMKMNENLGEIFAEENVGNTGAEKTKDYGKALAKYQNELKGNVYATIQDRMQNINSAFDSSFNELVSSYNNTKDVNKYSVIYTDGDYKNDTLGIDDYEYKVRGLLYMHEEEGMKLNNKFGYTLGFADTKFDFDDIPSKEEVYSLRAGVHANNTLSVDNRISLLSKLEVGYNRHKTTRNIDLGNQNFNNKAKFNTYNVSLLNKISKDIYKDFSTDVAVYGSVDIEYGKIDKFEEDGNLTLEIKNNDYLSTQGAIGVSGEHKIYTANDFVVKLSADGKVVHEFGDNYERNKVKLVKGNEGYYDLTRPEKKENALVGTIGVAFEKADQYGVTFEVTAKDESHKEKCDINYGVRFNYKW